MFMFRTITRNKQNILHRSYATLSTFSRLYPEILESVFESDLFKQVPAHNPHFKKLLEYNVAKEKNVKHSILLETYNILEKKENLSGENLRLANILAWCLEFIWTYTNISDDIIYQNEERDNKLPWHKQENVGLNGFNDAVFVYEAAFITLNKYFSELPSYFPLYDMFRRMHVHFIIGQTLECNLKINGKPQFNDFNTLTYMTLIKFKSGYPLVEAPYQAAHILSGNDDYERIKNVVTEISYLFQIGQDIDDVFENGMCKKNEAKSITQGNCTWMAVQVLERGSSDMIKTFTNNYGKSSPECQGKIIDLYLQMNLYDKYMDHKKKLLDDVHSHVKHIGTSTVKQALLNLYDKVQS